MKTCEKYKNKKLDNDWFEIHINECSICAESFKTETNLPGSNSEITVPANYFESLPDRVLNKIELGKKISEPKIIWVTSTAVAAVFLLALIFIISPSMKQTEIEKDLISMNSDELLGYQLPDNFQSVFDIYPIDEFDYQQVLSDIQVQDGFPADEENISDEELENAINSELQNWSKEKI